MSTKQKVLKKMNEFGMTGRKCSEIMGITYGSFRTKKSDKCLKDSFNEKNYEKLDLFIKKQVKYTVQS